MSSFEPARSIFRGILLRRRIVSGETPAAAAESYAREALSLHTALPRQA